MLDGTQVAAMLRELEVTHLVWLPDSALGPWEAAFEAEPSMRLVRLCREGEAWTLAAGLAIGGARPVVAIQNTGLFESGDAMRNVLFDLKLPLFAIIGYRSYLVEGSPDTARHYTEPILAAWGIDTVLIEREDQARRIAEHYRACQAAGRPGAALIAEGRM